MPDDRTKWAEKQIAELIEAGDDPIDAEQFVTEALALIPDDQDPNTFIPPYTAFALDAIDDEAIADARADWYANEDVPPRFKRILDAREEGG